MNGNETTESCMKEHNMNRYDISKHDMNEHKVGMEEGPEESHHIFSPAIYVSQLIALRPDVSSLGKHKVQFRVFNIFFS